MKLKKIICLTLSLLMMSACFAALPAMAADTTPPKTVADYNYPLNKLYDCSKNVNVEYDIDKDGVKTTKLSPKVATTWTGVNGALNSLDDNIDLSKYKYVVVEMFYETLEDAVAVPYAKLAIRKVSTENKDSETQIQQDINKTFYPMTQKSGYNGSSLDNRQTLQDGVWATYVFPLLNQTHSFGYDLTANGINYITYWWLTFSDGGKNNDFNVYIKSIKYTANAPYDITFEAAQNGLDTSDMKDFRFIASVKDVNLANYSEVGFDITRGSDSAKLNKNGTAVYSSILANGDEIKAESYGGKYIVALELNGVPTGTNDTLLVTPYLKDKKGNKISGKTVKVTIENGSVTECSWEVK